MVSLYIVIIKPIRIWANETIFYPIISYVNGSDSVILPSREVAMLGVEKEGREELIWMPAPLRSSFLVVLGFLFFQKKHELAKQFIYYSILLSIVPILFLLPMFNNFVKYIPFDLFFQLSTVLGLIFLMMGAKEDIERKIFSEKI
jgi:hypothetical protein